MDPWTTDEFTPFLCEFSLESSYEDFSEKRTLHIQVANSGSFTHESRFSILTSEDDAKSLDGFSCRDERRRIDGARDDAFSCYDERVDGYMGPEIKVTCHRDLNAFQSNAKYVSFLTKSEEESKGVLNKGGLWMEKKRISAIMDSRSAECVIPEKFERNMSLLGD